MAGWRSTSFRGARCPQTTSCCTSRQASESPTSWPLSLPFVLGSTDPPRFFLPLVVVLVGVAVAVAGAGAVTVTVVVVVALLLLLPLAVFWPPLAELGPGLSAAAAIDGH